MLKIWSIKKIVLYLLLLRGIKESPHQVDMGISLFIVYVGYFRDSFIASIA